MERLIRDIRLLIFNILALLLIWLLTFGVGRILFIAINSVKAVDVPITVLLESMARGMIFDISIWGYGSVLACVAFALTIWLDKQDADVCRRTLKVISCIMGTLAGFVIFLLPAEALTYKAWGHHVDASSLMMLADRPELVTASTETWFEVTYFTIMAIVSLVLFWTTYRLCRRASMMAYANTEYRQATNTEKVLTSITSIIIGGLMIIAIRGGLGLIPLNTGNAYFSQYQFANHVVVNPLWNFIYSTKYAKHADIKYEFMDDKAMEIRFSELMQAEGTPKRVFKTERPNIVIILLESFSAHGVEYLGGTNATPNIDSLRHTGIYFNNFFASSDRSGKGLIAVMNAYPSLPTIRVIQFPQKTQNIRPLARTLRDNGYANQTFIYGGDINFNNFNSLVNQAGFDRIITQDDFSKEEMGDKWGAHDQYTFDCLLKVMDTQPEPFFNFYFTLSSHEPFTVPMERKLDNDYLNSVYYTDSCLGKFMREARTRKWFSNTVFILLADHGHGGPENVGETDRRKFNIPLLLTGGAVMPQDSLVTTYGSQTDLTSTLLHQLGIESNEFTFSKDLLNPTAKSFAFFDFSDGFGYVTPDNYEVFDNQMSKFIRQDDATNTADTISGKAYLQKIAKDFHSR